MAAAATVSVLRAANHSHAQYARTGEKGEVAKKGGRRGNGRKPAVPRKPIYPPVNGLMVPSAQSDRSERCVSPFLMTLTPRVQECVTNVFTFDYLACKTRIEEVWSQQCAYIVVELVQTERSYIQALGEVIKGYITPLYSYLLESGQGPEFMQTVFCNIIRVYLTNLELLERLQNVCTDSHEFGQVFVTTDFSQYTRYCTNYSKGNACLEKSMAEDENLRAFLERCQVILGHSLPLDSLLIKPVQRILKYPLLLGKLSDNLEAQSSGYASVQEALERMTSVADQINGSFKEPGRSIPLALSPASIARRRSKEIKDLQKSRNIKAPKVQRSISLQPHPSYFPVYPPTHPIPPRPDSKTTKTPLPLPGRYARSKRIHQSLERLQKLETEREDTKERNRRSACMKRGVGSMPCVSELRDYFETLSISDGENSRASSVSPRTTPEHSPAAARKSSNRLAMETVIRRPRSSHFSLSRRNSNSSSTFEKVTAELRKKMGFSSRHSSSSSSSSSVIDNSVDRNE